MDEIKSLQIINDLTKVELKEYVTIENDLYTRYVPMPSGQSPKDYWYTTSGRFATEGKPAMSFGSSIEICKAERGFELGSNVQALGYEMKYQISGVPLFDTVKFANDYPETQDELYCPNGPDKYKASRAFTEIVAQKLKDDVLGFKAYSASGLFQGSLDERCIHIWEPIPPENIKLIDCKYIHQLIEE